jgi:hypothetical protein
MLVVALMMMASVASDVIQSRRRDTCFSYHDAVPASGDKVILADCDPTDTKQSSWVITTVSGSQETNNQIIQMCIKGTTLCIGTIKGALNDRLSVVLFDQDSTDTAQHWTVNPTRRTDQAINTYTNVFSNKCLHMEGGSFNAIVGTNICSEGDKRQHFLISTGFNKRF